MQPILALLIAGAVQDSHHPLNRLAASDSNFFAHIVELKDLRDESAHGSGIVRLTGSSDVEHYRYRTHQIIMDLYPSFRSAIAADNEVTMSPNPEGIDQLRLKTRIRLDTFFGIALVQMMSHALVEELIKLERWVDAEIELSGYINSMASALQIALFTVSSEHRSRLRDKCDPTLLAFEKAESAGFLLHGHTLPANLHSNQGRINQACSGSNVSLGTNLIAFLVLMPAERLSLIAVQVPGLISHMNQIVGLRGHGNKSSTQLEYELKETKIELLKETTFRTIKLLMENML